MSLGSRAIQALGLTEGQYGELKRMLPGQHLQAIARYIEITKVNKAEARAVIDAIMAGAVPGGGPPIIGADIKQVPLTESQFAEVRRLLPGKKIEAIKLCRKMTRLGLAEAKDIVDAMEKGAQPGGPNAAVSMTAALGSLHVTDEQNAQIRKLLETNKAEAIQLFHSLTTGGYAEAQNVIEAMQAGLRSPAPAAALGGSPPGGPSAPHGFAARLAALLPSGSRPPTPAEAATIAGHVARGAFDDAATQIGAGWGVDNDEAQRIAKRLRSRGNAVGWLFFVIAMALGLGLAGLVAYMAFQRP